MAFYLLVLLTAITLLASSNASTTTVSGNITPPDFRSLSGSQDDGPTTRLLSTDRTHDEKRAFGVPTASKIVEWMMTSKSAQMQKLSLAEKYRVQKWIDKQENADYVFKRLGLDGGVDKILTNPNLHLYDAYIKRLNKLNPTRKVTLADMFTATYEDAAMIKLLETKTTVAGTETFLAKIRDGLASSWVTRGKSEEDVFAMLTLDKRAHEIFSTSQAGWNRAHPTLKLYSAFIARFNEQNPMKKVKLLDMFVKAYGDDGVAKMAEIGKRSPSTGKFASRLKQDLLEKWEGNGESADDVFRYLKLDKAEYDLLASPQLNTWYAYIKNTYIWGQPEDFMVPILAKSYGYDVLSKIIMLGPRNMDHLGYLPMKLENAMVRQWLTKENPDSVFKLLKLDEGLDTLLTNPNLRMWESYTSMFNKQKPEEATTLMQTIRGSYNYKDLSGMLAKAKDVPETADIAKKWLRELRAHNLRTTNIKRF